MGFGTATDEQIINACIGGLLISAASSINLYLKGQITGMSGTLNGIINGDKDQKPWKICLLMGMFLTSSIFYLVQKQGQFFETVLKFESGLTIFGFIFAGYFTGLGAKLQNGCTSGHGVCGLPRLSIRSFVAVGTFMATAIGTSSLLYSSVFAKYNYNSYNMFQIFGEEGDTLQIIETCIILGISAAVIIAIFIIHKLKLSDNLVGLLIGVLFATGLIISGMVKRHTVLEFLTIGPEWNPSLMFVLGCACAPNMVTFYLMRNKTKKPVMAEKYCIPTNKTIDLKLIVGAVLFGIGWGVGGMCPGPVFCLIPTFYTEILILFGPALLLGLQSEMIFNLIKSKIKKEDNSQNNTSQNIQQPLKN